MPHQHNNNNTPPKKWKSSDFDNLCHKDLEIKVVKDLEHYKEGVRRIGTILEGLGSTQEHLAALAAQQGLRVKNLAEKDKENKANEKAREQAKEQRKKEKEERRLEEAKKIKEPSPPKKKLRSSDPLPKVEEVNPYRPPLSEYARVAESKTGTAIIIDVTDEVKAKEAEVPVAKPVDTTKIEKDKILAEIKVKQEKQHQQLLDNINKLSPSLVQDLLKGQLEELVKKRALAAEETEDEEKPASGPAESSKADPAPQSA